MEIEERDDLIRVIRSGSKRATQRIKKETLLDLVRDLWKEQKESREHLEKELGEIEEKSVICQGIIDSQERINQTIEEYQALVSEVREKHDRKATELRKAEEIIEHLVSDTRTLKRTIWILIGIEILTIIIGIII
jgi:esterase/lipase